MLTEQKNPIVERIDKRLAELDMSRSAASLQAGLSRDGIRNLSRDPNAKPRGGSLEQLATVLGVSPTWLLTGQDDRTGTDRPAPPQTHPATSRPAVTLPPLAEMPRDVPVMGTAAGSVIDNGFEGFELSGPVDYVRRPPALSGARDAYAIYITGESMAPAHPAGELRFVHPHRPIHPGCTVIVQTRTWNDDPGQAYIKTLERRSGDRVIVSQHNPQATIEIPSEFVIVLHRVLTMNELFGV